MDFVPVTNGEQIRQTAELAKQIWTEHFTPIIGPAQVEYMLDTIQSENAITDQIQNKGNIYYLIENYDKTVGYCAYVLEESSLFLSKLYVLKSMRERGIARQTIDFVKSIALEKKLSKIILTVNKDNAGPIAAYEKLGFVITGPVIQDIGSGFVMDDFKMQLDLL